MFNSEQLGNFYNRLPFLLKCIAVILLILGGRLWLIKVAGVAVPYYDEWEVGFNTLAPYMQDSFRFSSLFTTYGEHPIVLTRLLMLLLVELNGQWDPLLEMAVNAVIYTITATLMVVILRNLLGNTIDNWLLLGVAAIGVLPFAWLNILWGFQSCWYLLLLFTLLALWGLLLHDHLTWPWWVGMTSGILACLNLASGFFALAVVVVIKLYLIVINRENLKEHRFTLITSVIFIGLFFISFLLAPKHSMLYSHDLSEFLVASSNFLAWPWIDYPWLSGIIYLPFFTLCAGIFWYKRKPEKSELFILAIGMWVVMQIMAAAFARGAGPGAHSLSRYWDLFSLGILANLLCFYSITRAHFKMSEFKHSIWIFANVWGLLVFAGLFNLAISNIPTIQYHHRLSNEYVNFTRAVLQDSRDLKAIADKYRSPYPFPRQIANFLQIPSIRAILPSSLIIPPPVGTEQNNGAFIEDGFFKKTPKYQGETVIGSYGHHGNVEIGRFVSTPITIVQPFMEIAVAGYLGEADLSLHLVTDNETIPIIMPPSTLIKEKWRIIHLKTPTKPFRIVATDNRTDLWFAFSVPRGVGALSFYNSRLLDQGQSIFLWGLLLLGIVVLPSRIARLTSNISHSVVTIPKRPLWAILTSNTAMNSLYFKLFIMIILIFGSRLWFIQTFGTSVPVWDQWNGEGENLFVPWLEGTLSWQAMFSAHNEHRIVFSRLFSLLLLLMNDTQWDPQVEMVANALVAVTMAVSLVIILRQLLGKAFENLIILSMTFLWVVPYSWESILSGFQSAFYLMIFFSLLALWGVLLHANFTARWWFGILCALCAYFNLASGFFAASVIIVIKVYLSIIDPSQRRSHLVTAIICGLIVSVSLVFTAIIPGLHTADAYYANHTAFAASFGRYLAWPWVAPFVNNPQMTLFLCLPILYLPFIIFTARIVWYRLNPTPAELFVLALGGWVILQTASMAYARGIFLGPAARYMDILALGTLANLLALCLWPWSISLENLRNRILRLWTVFVVLGVLGVYITHIPIVEQQRSQRVEFLKNTREFLLTNDINALKDKMIPFISAPYLATWLNHPQLRRILPTSLATPGLVQVAYKDNGVFVVDGFYPTTGSYQKERTFGSFSHLGNAATGRFLSEPISITQTFMEIPVAGYLGESDLTLRLVVEGESQPRVVVPPVVPKESWVACVVRAPTKPFRIEAVDNRNDLWFAFAMPRGIGKLSIIVTWLLKWGYFIFFLGALLASQLEMAILSTNKANQS